jgi:multidrug efflux pump
VVAVLITLSIWPLYQGSRRELAPVEDQSHISMFFDVSPDATLEAVDRRVARSRRQSEGTARDAVHVVAGRQLGRLRRHGEQELEGAGSLDFGRRTCRSPCRPCQVPGVSVFPRLDPPLPTSGQHDVELDAAELGARRRPSGHDDGRRRRWLGERQVPYVDTDLKIDRPEATVKVDREKVADLGMDLAGVGRELGALLGGGYVNRFNYFDRSYKVIPQIGRERPCDSGPAARPQDQDADGRARAGVVVRDHRDHRQAAHAEPLPAAQLGQDLRRGTPGVTKAEGLEVFEQTARHVAGNDVNIDYAGESRQIKHEGSSLLLTLGFAIVLVYLVLAAQFRSFRDPLIVLLGSVPLAIRVLPWCSRTSHQADDDDQRLLAGRPDHAGRLIAKNGILIVEFANVLQEQGRDKLSALREAAARACGPC